jgi:hypothetical protein
VGRVRFPDRQLRTDQATPGRNSYVRSVRSFHNKNNAKETETKMTTPFSIAQGDNPFSVAVEPPSIFPKMVQLNGLLLLIKPVKLEMVYENARFVKPGAQPQLVERMSADVEAVDHMPPGFDTNVFPAMYISGSRLITQLRGNLATGQPQLGRLSLFKPNEPAGAGNPWGLAAPTPEDVQLALRHIAGTHRLQPSAATPTPAPVPLHQAPAPQYPVQAPAPQYQAPVPVQAPAPVPLHQGTNPFA